jgi:hypothetical protein
MGRGNPEAAMQVAPDERGLRGHLAALEVVLRELFRVVVERAGDTTVIEAALPNRVASVSPARTRWGSITTQ